MTMERLDMLFDTVCAAYENKKDENIDKPEKCFIDRNLLQQLLSRMPHVYTGHFLERQTYPKLSLGLLRNQSLGAK